MNNYTFIDYNIISLSICLKKIPVNLFKMNCFEYSEYFVYPRAIIRTN